MRKVLTAGILLTLLLASVAQAEQKEAENRLKERYKGKLLTLQGFHTGESLRFNSEGKLLKGGPPGPWKVYGVIEVRNLKVKKDSLRIDGSRLLVTFAENGDPKYYRHALVRIEIEIKPGSSLEDSIQSSMAKVFLSGR